MKKKLFRNLFDSDDVYEVEEITDDPDISTSGIAQVKKDESGAATGESEKEPTIKDCWDAIKKIADAVGCSLSGETKKDSNEPAEGNKVTTKGPDVDKSKSVTTNDSDDEDDETKKVEDEDGTDDTKGEDEKTKEVKDAYSAFARAGEKGKQDIAQATQVAFQHRYDAVANK